MRLGQPAGGRVRGDLLAAVPRHVAGGLAPGVGDLDGDGLPDHADCPACHIAGSADLPPTDHTLRDADLAFVAQVTAPRESCAVRAVLDPARGLRAPPLA